MVNTLGSLRAVIDHDAESTIGDPLLAGHLLSDEEQMAKQRDVALLGLGELREVSANLGNDEKVDGSLGADVSESKALVVLEDDLGRYLLADNLVEDGRTVARGGRVGLVHFGSHCSPQVQVGVGAGKRGFENKLRTCPG